jgi:hypothetical protein
MVALLVLELTLIAGETGAQVAQYTPPGGPALPAGDAKEQFEKEMEGARWRLGPLRLAPWFGIRQLSYQDDVFASGDGGEKVSDVTATVGAGLTAYLPTGRQVFWTAEAIPEYVWWQDQQDRRQLVGRWGAGVFGFFNRLEVRASAGRLEAQGTASSELPQPIIARQDRADAGVELRLTGKLGLFAGARWAEIRNRSDDADDPRLAPFERLDREERALRGGLVFFPGSRTRIGLGAERYDLESAATARDVSAAGTSPILEARTAGNRLAFDVHLALRRLDPVGDSAFSSYDRLAGDVQATFNPGWRFGFQLYGSRNPALTLAEDYAHFDEVKVGVALASRAGRRLRLRVFAERGENRYRPLDDATAARTDDTRAAGAELGLELGGALGVELRAVRSEVDSPLPGLSREVTTVSGGFALSTSRLVWR